MWLSSNAHNHLRLPHRPEAPGAGQRAQAPERPVHIRLARKYLVEYWMDNWTVSDVTGHASVIGQYPANAIISDNSK